MGKIYIEYCGGWGFGGPALRLKKALMAAFPNVEIDCQSADGWTNKVEVYWIEGATKKLYWSKGKADTENGHNEIITLLKSAWWNRKERWNWKLNDSDL